MLVSLTNPNIHFQIGPDPFDEVPEKSDASAKSSENKDKPGLRSEDRQDSGFCEDEEDVEHEKHEDPERNWMRMVRSQRQRWSSESAIV